MTKIKNYEVSIPVFKQGDDLHHCIKNTSNSSEAFLMQAENYECAAAVCRRLASFLAETPEAVLDGACTHWIGISGPEDKLAGLVSDGILYKSYCEDDEDFEDLEDQEEG